ncbi:MAG: hypothetical protein IPM08_00550 [Actinomycetales bacterium]|nr:hypothetical protein [Actinomycetales bacterium]
MTAAVSGARRPTTADPSNSSRPASSSERVWRRTTAYPKRARKTAPIIVIFATAMESTLAGLPTGPYSATAAGEAKISPIAPPNDSAVG